MSNITTATADPREMGAAMLDAARALDAMDARTDSYADALVAHVAIVAPLTRALSVRQWADWCRSHHYAGHGALRGAWLGKNGAAAWPILSAVLALSDGSPEDRGAARLLVLGARDGRKALAAIISAARDGAAREAMAARVSGAAESGESLDDFVRALAAETPGHGGARQAKPVPAPAAPVSGPESGPESDPEMGSIGSASKRVRAALAILQAVERDGQTPTAGEARELARVAATILQRAGVTVGATA